MTLFSLPVARCQDFRQYRGHGCPVRNCGFLADDGSLVTSGGRDCAVLLWAFEARADAEGAGMADSSSMNGGDKYVLADDPEVETVVMADEDRARHPDLRDLSRQVFVFYPMAWAHF